MEHHLLVELLQTCQLCAGHSDVALEFIDGAYVKYSMTCMSCQHCWQWGNSEKIRRTPLINILICSGILFSGSLPSKFLRALAKINVRVPSTNSFHHYQKKYLHGVSLGIM